MPDKTAASFFVYDADKMTDEGRRHIATWLRQQANFLVKHGHDYAPKFRARYMYAPGQSEREVDETGLTRDDTKSTPSRKPVAVG